MHAGLRALCAGEEAVLRKTEAFRQAEQLVETMLLGVSRSGPAAGFTSRVTLGMVTSLRSHIPFPYSLVLDVFS